MCGCCNALRCYAHAKRPQAKRLCVINVYVERSSSDAHYRRIYNVDCMLSENCVNCIQLHDDNFVHAYVICILNAALNHIIDTRTRKNGNAPGFEVDALSGRASVRLSTVYHRSGREWHV